MMIRRGIICDLAIVHFITTCNRYEAQKLKKDGPVKICSVYFGLDTNSDTNANANSNLFLVSLFDTLVEVLPFPQPCAAPVYTASCQSSECFAEVGVHLWELGEV